MERYKDSVKTIRNNGNGERRYETMYYPRIPRKDSDIYIIAKSMYRLDNLAWEHYQDTTLWWVIHSANNFQRGTLMVPPGTRIRIPFPLDDFELQMLVDKANQNE